MSMELLVDRGKCMGSGNCSFHAPHTFDLDDQMKVVVMDPDGDSADAVANAVEGCPTKAISIVVAGR